MIGKKTGISLETKKSVWGYVFLIPFAIGFVFFFLSPFIFYIVMAFSTKHDGMTFTFTGLDNARYILSNNPQYIVSVFKSLKELLTELFTIVFYSLFISVLLNQKFAGRGFVRAMFFLPVIVSSGIVTVSGTRDTLVSSAMNLLNGTNTSDNIKMSQNISENILTLFGNNAMTSQLVSIVSGIVSEIYTVTQKSGVQILIFLSGLQTISGSLYEASEIDGATAWENFWKITLPMISPMVLVNMVYTAIDLLASMDNDTINLIYTKSMNLEYTDSAMMGVMYLSIVLIILAVVLLVTSKFVYYEDRIDKSFRRRHRI